MIVDRESPRNVEHGAGELLREGGRPQPGTLELMRALDPEFTVPRSSRELKAAKLRLRQRVTGHVERLFLERLLDDNAGNMSATARAAEINRTFLYRLLKRHNLLPAG